MVLYFDWPKDKILNATLISSNPLGFPWWVAIFVYDAIWMTFLLCDNVELNLIFTLNMLIDSTATSAGAIIRVCSSTQQVLTTLSNIHLTTEIPKLSTCRSKIARCSNVYLWLHLSMFWSLRSHESCVSTRSKKNKKCCMPLLKAPLKTDSGEDLVLHGTMRWSMSNVLPHTPI